jgi:hypothetical protein
MTCEGLGITERGDFQVKNKGIILLLIMAVTFNFSSVYGVDGWEANLAVTILNAENRLSFGQRGDATDGIDGKYDVPAMLSGDIRAYFLIDEGSYWRDIRSLTTNNETKVWNIKIESGIKNEAIILKWNPGNLLKKGKTVLIDAAIGVVIDMKSNNQYSFRNNGTKNLRIEVTP